MKTFLIFAGVGLVCLLLMVRFFFSEFNSNDKEREWFVRNLRYEFSVTVDSVQQHYRTFVDGHITAGDPHLYREDSLKNSLKKHGNLRFVTTYHTDSISFTLEEFVGEIHRGDSIRVSSKENSLTVFRTGEKLISVKLSDVLTGWGKPPFRTQ